MGKYVCSHMFTNEFKCGHVRICMSGCVLCTHVHVSVLLFVSICIQVYQVHTCVFMCMYVCVYEYAFYQVWFCMYMCMVFEVCQGWVEKELGSVLSMRS